MATPKITPEPDAGHVPLSEEIDSAKYTMPGTIPVIGSIVLVAVLLGLVAWFWRAKPVAQGSIGEVAVVEVPKQHSSFVSVHLNLTNATEKPLFIKNVVVTLHGAWGEASDDFVPAVDVQRYAKMFPELQSGASQVFTREQRIAPNSTLNGVVVVNVPLTMGDVQTRKGMEVTVNFFDHKPIILRN